MYSDAFSASSYAPEPDDPSGYSTEKFYTRSRGPHGEKESLKNNGKTVAVTPEMHAAVHEAISIWPKYRTAEDVIRDGIAHLLHMRHEQLKNPSSAMTLELCRMEAQLEMETIVAQQRAQKEFIANTREMIRGAQSKAQKEHVQYVVERYLSTIFDPVIRKKIKDALREDMD